jgi:HSP20 family molecular chaperone IbpA
MTEAIAARMALQPVAPPRILTGPEVDTLQSTIYNMLSCRAYELYEARGCETGHDLDDWLQAEQELVRAENLEVTDRGHEIRIRSKFSTLPTGEISVGISPQRVIILAENLAAEATSQAAAVSRQPALLEIVDLVPRINPNEAVARLADGILEITLPQGS